MALDTLWARRQVLVDRPTDATAGTGRGGESTPHSTIVRLKRTMVWGVALLWLLDAVLQAQPRMFTLDFVSNIMTPSIASAPSILTGLATWTINLVSPNIAVWNWLFTFIQFAIAVSLLTGLVRRNEVLVKGGLIMSIVWGFGVWVFGEGTSGVFTGNGTILTGAPGAVLLYVLIAAFYFLPDRHWNLRARWCLPRDALALVFLYGVAAQLLTQPFWGPQGIPALLQGQASMAASWMSPIVTAGVQLTLHAPAVWNAGFAIALLAIATLLIGRRPHVAGFLMLGVTLLVVWCWGQDLGGMFSGMGTDPGTPPLFAIMAIPAWTIVREHGASFFGMLRRNPQVCAGDA